VSEDPNPVCGGGEHTEACAAYMLLEQIKVKSEGAWADAFEMKKKAPTVSMDNRAPAVASTSSSSSSSSSAQPSTRPWPQQYKSV
jgi:hypothetical protein